MRTSSFFRLLRFLFPSLSVSHPYLFSRSCRHVWFVLGPPLRCFFSAPSQISSTLAMLRVAIFVPPKKALSVPKGSDSFFYSSSLSECDSLPFGILQLFPRFEVLYSQHFCSPSFSSLPLSRRSILAADAFFENTVIEETLFLPFSFSLLGS